LRPLPTLLQRQAKRAASGQGNAVPPPPPPLPRVPLCELPSRLDDFFGDAPARRAAPALGLPPAGVCALLRTAHGPQVTM